MKQHITLRDLAELGKEELEKHHRAFYPPYFMLQTIDKKLLERVDGKKPSKLELSDDGRIYVYIPDSGEFYAQPSIGQMIEYLTEKGIGVKLDVVPEMMDGLCDFLWKEVVRTYA